VVALVLVSLLHLVLGEMVPKNIALAGPERVLMALAIPNVAYTTVLRPVIVGLDKLSNAGVRLFGIEPKSEFDEAHTAADLSVMLAESRSEGLIPEFEHDLLSGALDFGDRPVEDVMVPRNAIVTVTLRTTVQEVEQIVVERGHSRLPVLGRDLDDVLGFIHVKDLLPLPESAQGRPVRSLRLRRLLEVTTGSTLEDALLKMQKSRLHLAAVVDDQGRTAGLLSLEDILESLVGDIRDESDQARAR
jgi:CBS domain containing-hemolysin-like protein